MTDPEVTPPLDEFLREYEQDNNIWWGMGCGHHQNLFEAAVERMQVSPAVTGEMVERAAVAACEFVYPPKTHRAWEDVDDYEQNSWRATVRVALDAALRAGEPS